MNTKSKRLVLPAVIVISLSLIASGAWFVKVRNAAPSTLAQQLKSGDAKQQQQALETVRRAVTENPKLVGDQIEQMTGVLLDQKKFDEVESLALTSILQRPQDANKVSDAQGSRVEACLNAGKFEQALCEAKSYYNVASMADTARAIRLLGLALTNARSATDADVVSRFGKQQLAGAYVSGIDANASTTQPADAPNASAVLASIKIDPAPYLKPIDAQSGSDSASLLARGNLLLLADRPAEARQCFATVCKAEGLDKKVIYVAAEGVARAVRAERGQIGPANVLILSLKLGTPSALARQIFSDGSLAGNDFQRACEGNLLAELPAEFTTAAPGAASEPSDDAALTSARATTHPNTGQGVPDPLLVARATPREDVPLNGWLDRWRSTSAGKSVEPAQRAELGGIIEKSRLPSVTLFWLGYGFHAASQDSPTSVLFYHAAAARAHEELRPDLSAAKVRTVIQAMNSTMTDYKAVLWPMIESGDKPALQTLYTVYCDYPKYCPPNERKLVKALNHVTIGLAECTYLQGRDEDALKLLQKLDGTMTEGERVARAWALGLVLLRMEQYRDAAAQFGAVADSPSSKYRINARSFLVLCLARSGEVDRAREEFGKLVKLDEKGVFLPSTWAAIERARDQAKSGASASPEGRPARK